MIPGLVTWMSWMMNSYVGTLLWRAYNSKAFRGVVEDRDEVSCEIYKVREIGKCFFIDELSIGEIGLSLINL